VGHAEATRDAYDTVAAAYAEAVGDELTARPLDRALLAAFAESVPAGSPVADLGCGPGHVAAHLAGLGLDVIGVDLSPQMVRVAAAAHPSIRFVEASMTSLPMDDGALGGLVAFYSIIHTPPQELPSLLAELRRVLAPGAPALFAFQVPATAEPSEHRRIEHGFGHDVAFDAYRFAPALVAELLESAGMLVQATLVRGPVDATEKGERAYLLARAS
jgi:SAM-dependent methyltransferase